MQASDDSASSLRGYILSGTAIRNAFMALAVCAAIVLALRFIATGFYLPAIPFILVVAATVAIIPRNRLIQIQILLPAALGVAAVEVLMVNGIPLAPAFALALALASLGTGVWLSGLRHRTAH
jgi:hypothetical protein